MFNTCFTLWLRKLVEIILTDPLQKSKFLVSDGCSGNTIWLVFQMAILDEVIVNHKFVNKRVSSSLLSVSS